MDAEGVDVPLVMEATPRHQAPRRAKDDFSWLSLVAFLFLTYNSLAAVYRSLDDPWTVSFVAVSYFDLLLLFVCLRLFEKSPENSPRRRRLKFAVWSLASVLTTMFSYKVADIMPFPLAVVVWGMGALTVGGGFWAFFIYGDKQ